MIPVWKAEHAYLKRLPNKHIDMQAFAYFDDLIASPPSQLPDHKNYQLSLPVNDPFCKEDAYVKKRLSASAQDSELPSDKDIKKSLHLALRLSALLFNNKFFLFAREAYRLYYQDSISHSTVASLLNALERRFVAVHYEGKRILQIAPARFLHHYHLKPDSLILPGIEPRLEVLDEEGRHCFHFKSNLRKSYRDLILLAPPTEAVCETNEYLYVFSSLEKQMFGNSDPAFHELLAEHLHQSPVSRLAATDWLIERWLTGDLELKCSHCIVVGCELAPLEERGARSLPQMSYQNEMHAVKPERLEEEAEGILSKTLRTLKANDKLIQDNANLRKKLKDQQVVSPDKT